MSTVSDASDLEAVLTGIIAVILVTLGDCMLTISPLQVLFCWLPEPVVIIDIIGAMPILLSSRC